MNSIIFAGGCFWGVQHYFKGVKGVVNTSVGYTQGQTKFPSYEKVCSGNTGHTEACKIEYDPSQTNLFILLVHLFNIIDPTALNRQAYDVGTQYRTGVYYYEDSDREIIENFINSVKDTYVDPIVVEVAKATEYWEAEDYHQNYLDINVDGYCHIPKIRYKNVGKVDEMARDKYYKDL